jgi:hypothetical protein
MDYSTKISETVAELQQLEKQQTKAAHRDRLRFNGHNVTGFLQDPNKFTIVSTKLT